MGILVAYFLGVLTGASQPAKNRSAEFNPDEKRKKERREGISFWVGILTLVVLSIYTGFTILIWRSTKQANLIAIDGFISAQRAYITNHGIKHVFKTTTNPSGKQVKSFDFSPQWENAGNTPAVGVLVLSGSAVFTTEITQAWFMGKTRGSPTPTTMASIGPRQSWESQATHQPEAFATEDLEYPRYVWGWLLYKDVFPNTKVHVTEFCFKSTSITPTGSDYDFAATVCNGHNCVDEFCDDYSAMVTMFPHD